MAKQLNKKVVLHWIGSDVLDFRDYISSHRCLPGYLTRLVDVCLAVCPGLQEELKSLGIHTRIIKLISPKIEADIQKLPDKPAVLVYFSGESRQEFYGCSYILSLARKLPDIPFYVVGSGRGKLTNAPANMSFLGEVADMESIYRRISVHIRFTEHDAGQPSMVLESLARGRYVLFNHAFPHTTKVTTIQDGITALKKALSATTTNLEGAAYVRENFSWQHEIEKLKDIYTELLT
jgi:glycosyltransferase involved in cell wall biosynthesis